VDGRADGELQVQWGELRTPGISQVLQASDIHLYIVFVPQSQSSLRYFLIQNKVFLPKIACNRIRMAYYLFADHSLCVCTGGSI